jgi:hypothetical protein
MEAPEARALGDFLILHPEIALVVTYGSLDNVVEKPKGVADTRNKRVPLFGVLEADAEFHAELSKRYGELVGSPRRRAAALERGTLRALGATSTAGCSRSRPALGHSARGAEEGGDAKRARRSPNVPAGNPAEEELQRSLPRRRPRPGRTGLRTTTGRGRQPGKRTRSAKPAEDAKRLCGSTRRVPVRAARFVAWHALRASRARARSRSAAGRPTRATSRRRDERAASSREKQLRRSS